MNNEIMTFTNTEFGNLDVLIENDKYYFPASECAEKLGYVNPRKAILDHCPHVTKRDIGVRTGLKADGTPAFQTVTKTFIPECDLYRLIVRSKLPAVQKFENWVFEDVLPTIRKHGAYIMPELLEELQRNTAKNAELLSQLAKEQRSRQNLEACNAELQKLAGMLKRKNDTLREEKQQLESAAKDNAPKVSYYDIIMQNPCAIPVTLIAKDYGLSAREFNARLHEYRIQFRINGTWALYQDYAGNGYTHDNVYTTRDSKRAVNHMCWTQKGRRFLYDFLKERGVLPMIER